MQHVIIGAGPAGVIAAETLRKNDSTCSIKLIGDETEPPYSRMALPYYLISNIDEAGTYLRKSSSHYADLDIEIIQDRVASVDPDAHTVTLSGGAAVNFDRLLIATGSHPIRPPIPGAGFARRPFLLDPGGWQEYRRQGRHGLRRHPDGGGFHRLYYPGGACRARGGT